MDLYPNLGVFSHFPSQRWGHEPETSFADFRRSAIPTTHRHSTTRNDLSESITRTLETYHIQVRCFLEARHAMASGRNYMFSELQCASGICKTPRLGP